MKKTRRKNNIPEKEELFSTEKDLVLLEKSAPEQVFLNK